jgi:protein-disulfide isomerase
MFGNAHGSVRLQLEGALHVDRRFGTIFNMVRTRMKSLFAVTVAIGVMVAQTTFAAGAGNPAGEDKRIARAINAYAAKLKTNQDRARDEWVARNETALLNDPHTPVIGDPKADVAIVEFFDYACPFCKAVEPRLEAFLKTDKRVKLVVKEFPILTPESLIAAKASLAAVSQGKYRQFHQALMMFKGQLREPVIFDTAKDVGLDVNRLRKDMRSPAIADEIIANFNLARAIRAVDTPTFIVDGRVLTEPSAEIDFPKTVAAARQK